MALRADSARTVLLALALLVGPVPALAQSYSSHSASNSVSTGTYIAAPVVLATDPNPGMPLNLAMSQHDDYFLVRNFGTEDVWRLSIAQTLSSSTLRYCSSQAFTKKDPLHCADGSMPVEFGVGLSIPDVLLAAPIAPGEVLHFSAVATAAGHDVISVSVRPEHSPHVTGVS